MDPQKLLIIEDEFASLKALVLCFKNYQVFQAENGKRGLDFFRQEQPKVVLTDVKLPDINGMSILETIRKENSNTLVILMTAFGTIDKAVEAMKIGAFDYLTKPLDLTILRNLVQEAFVQTETRIPKISKENSGIFEGIVGSHPRMTELFQKIDRFARANAPVLILGESGTGKELVAHAIHRRSGRKNKPFIHTNLSALSEHLVESELFGHMKGSFTHAIHDKKGKFELADNGTLFLDEIGEIPLSLQIKLLRVLTTQEIEKVGGNSHKINVRLLAATNADLTQKIQDGLFREDFYYRLNVLNLNIPPLRERLEEIPALVDHFLEKFRRQNPDIRVKGVHKDALTLFRNYHWPGNIRQLENVLENAFISASKEYLTPELFPLDIRTAHLQNYSIHFKLGTSLKEVEKEMILTTLGYVNNNKTKAASILGIGTRTLYRKLEEYGI
ncbi:MAG: sigma-54 dependent transcriptional regulator, partial [Planctomycetota bacterium]